MISFENSKAKDLLPFTNLRIRAISYALNKQIVKLKMWSDTSRVRAMIDTLQEQAIDLLAKELNTPFYDITFDINRKRTLVKNTNIYYEYLATRYGIQMILQDAFGGGGLYSEWYEYGGEPFHFYVSVKSRMYSEEAKEAFLRELKKYSRLSCFCDGIILEANTWQKVYEKHNWETLANKTWEDVYIDSDLLIKKNRRKTKTKK